MASFPPSPPPSYVNTKTDMEARIAKLESLLLQQQSLFATADKSSNSPSIQELKADPAAQDFITGIEQPSTSPKIEAFMEQPSAIQRRDVAEKVDIERDIKQARHCAIKFRDALGRNYTFPYDSIDTWAGLSTILTQIFLPIPIVGPHVSAGHFDIFNNMNEIILPAFWAQKVEPGQYYTMYMWPMPGQVTPPEWSHVHFIRDKCAFPYRPGPPPPMGPPPPGWIRPRRNVPSSASSDSSEATTAVDLHENCGIRGVWNKFKGIFRKKQVGKDSDTRSISTGSSCSLADD